MDDVTAVVTGGATSLGLAISTAFAERGATVSIGDIDEDAGERAASSLREDTPGDALFVPTDVTESAACDALMDRTADEYGGIDVLVNNAGYRDVIAVDDVTDEDWRRHIAINLDGAFYCCRAAIPYLRDSPRARIINLSSAVAREGHPLGAAPYVSAKAGVIGLTRSLAREVGGDGIIVNAIAPAIIRDTGMQEGADVDRLDRNAETAILNRLPRREDIVYAAMCLAAADNEMIHGQTIDVNGGRFMR